VITIADRQSKWPKLINQNAVSHYFTSKTFVSASVVFGPGMRYYLRVRAGLGFGLIYLMLGYF